MKRTFIKVMTSSILVASLLTGCGNTNDNNNASLGYDKMDTDLKVGMVTDSGTIDDRSFNQYTWEAISSSIPNSKYLKPSGQADADYLESITNLYDADYKLIIAPGFKFERAIATAAEKYQDARFVIIDGEPKDSEGKSAMTDNTVAVYFAEQEAGFIAAVAAATQIGEGEFGFIGGMEIPNVVRFMNGFKQGVQYANENLGTHIALKDENMIFQGSFTDKAGGQQVAASMYDKGVDVIFTAAGGTGIGAINEAKSRAMNGETDCYVIGVDVDQYQDGVYDTQNNASVVLTSAVKNVSDATVSILQSAVNDTFQGGQIITFTAKNGGVGIPAENPNLSDAAISAVQDVTAKLSSGEIVVNE